MLERIRAKLSFSNVISVMALFIVLGGGAYAANGNLAQKAATVTKCPKAAPNRIAALCFSKSFARAQWQNALLKCRKRKSKLPTIGEAFQVYLKVKKGETWTDEVADVAPTQLRVTVRKNPNVPNGIQPFALNTNASKPYRCVTIPTG